MSGIEQHSGLARTLALPWLCFGMAILAWPLDRAMAGTPGTPQVVALVGVREDFGISQYIRIVPPHQLEYCRLQSDQVLERRVLDKLDAAAQQAWKELFAELERLQREGWPPRKPDPQGSATSNLPVDGPQWRFYLIARDGKAMEARDLAGYPSLAGLINLLQDAAHRSGVQQTPVKATLVDWRVGGPGTNRSAQVWRTQEAPAERLLAACGGLTPEPLPADLRAALATSQEPGWAEISGQRFRVQRVQP